MDIAITLISALHWYLYNSDSDIGSAYHIQHRSYEGVMGCVHLSTSYEVIKEKVCEFPEKILQD